MGGAEGERLKRWEGRRLVVVVVAMVMVRYGLDDTHTCDCEALRIYKVLEKGEKATLSRSLADHAIGFGTGGSFARVYLGSLYLFCTCIGLSDDNPNVFAALAEIGRLGRSDMSLFLKETPPLYSTLSLFLD